MRHRGLLRVGQLVVGVIATGVIAVLLAGSPFGGRIADADGSPITGVLPSVARVAQPATPISQYLPLVPGRTQLVSPGWSTAVVVLTVEVDRYVGTGGNPTVYSLLFDGNLNTPTVSQPGYSLDFVNNDKWLYIGNDVPFTKIRLYSKILPGGYGGGLWGQGNPNGPAAQYFDGQNWAPFSVTSDTTIVGGDSFAQAGVIEFTLSGGPMVRTTEGAMTAYFIRGRFNNSADRIHISEIQPWGFVHVGS